MKAGLHQWIWHRAPVLVYCAAIFIQSSFPAPQAVSGFLLSDKLLHVAGYAVLGALCLRAMRTFPIKSASMLLLLSILFSAFYGVTDEIHQLFVPSRNGDPWDVIADTMGSVLGVAGYYLMERINGFQHSFEK
jgi:VanZ family protein